MQFKRKFACFALCCALSLSGAVLLMNVRAQSPQQAQIVFTSDRDGNREIYVMDTDGENPRRLTNNPAHDQDPSWSPDGKLIAFFSTRDGNSEIYVMDANGDNQRRLTKNPTLDGDPAWSPDGQGVAFVSIRDANDEIYVMDADGGNQHNLTNNPADDSRPDWFDPAFAYSVTRAGKLRSTWGWLKQNSE